jgi:hypothetical protein
MFLALGSLPPHLTLPFQDTPVTNGNGQFVIPVQPKSTWGVQQRTIPWPQTTPIIKELR